MRRINLKIKICVLFLVLVLPGSIAKAAECLSPHLSISQETVAQRFADFSFVRNVSYTAQDVDLLFSTEVPVKNKVSYLMYLARTGIDDKYVSTKLKEFYEQNHANELGYLAGALLLRHNPAFWLDDEYLHMDADKFRALLKKRSSRIDGAGDMFIRALEDLNEFKQEYLLSDPERWSYPYSCMHMSGLALMQKLKKYNFVSMLVARGYPPESELFGFHSYLKVILDGEFFIVDLTATQFHKLNKDLFLETGIVVIPEKDILDSPGSFGIYTQGRSLQQMTAVTSLPPLRPVMKDLLERIINGEPERRITFLDSPNKRREVCVPFCGIRTNGISINIESAI